MYATECATEPGVHAAVPIFWHSSRFWLQRLPVASNDVLTKCVLTLLFINYLLCTW